MTNLQEVLMAREDLTYNEASEIIAEMRRLIYEEEVDPEELLFEEGLEPDYIFDLISI
jgi:hypothetical protein